MWKYKIRLSLVPQATSIRFAGERIDLDSNGCVLSPVSEDLAHKLANAPHVFAFDSSASKTEEKVVSSQKKRTRSRKKKED